MRVLPDRHHIGGVIAAGLLVLMSPVTPTGTAAASSCEGIQVRSAQELRQTIAHHPPHTRFCLHPGTYTVDSTITLKSQDRLIGTARHRDGVLVRTTSAQIIFDLHHTRGVRFRHFAITGAVNACPGRNCRATGRAISQGRYVTVKEMHLYRNHQKAIGGTEGGLRVINSEIDHNGSTPQDALSGGMKVTHSATIKGSYIHDNFNNGVWCDDGCGRFVVKGNTVKRNAGNGIFMEVSQGPATIANNIVKHNNTADLGAHGGISLTNSKDANVYGNTLGANRKFGFSARMDNRTMGWLIGHVRVHGNAFHGDALRGCELPGQTCYNNH
jgi:Right handed beta helix region